MGAGIFPSPVFAFSEPIDRCDEPTHFVSGGGLPFALQERFSLVDGFGHNSADKFRHGYALRLSGAFDGDFLFDGNAEP